jgi:ribonuclease G
LAEWLYEAGIGENRAALVSRGSHLEGADRAGGSGPRHGGGAECTTGRQEHRQGRAGEGGEALCDPCPQGITQGGTLRVRIVREAIPEPGRAKLPKAVPGRDAVPGDGPRPARPRIIRATGVPVRMLRAHEPDLLEEAGWSEVLEEAVTGEIAFPAARCGSRRRRR